MDIFSLGNILNALRFNKKVESTGKSPKAEENKPVEAQGAVDSEDTVTISDEAVLKSVVEQVSQDVRQAQDVVREDKVAQIKEKVQNKEYQVPSKDVADKVVRGVDIYDILK